MRISGQCAPGGEWRLEEIAERYGVEKTYTDYNDMLADPEIDMVSIVTHVKDHAEPAVAALRAGKHVFLEKPMATTLEECERIVRET
ncbi:MAG TPA: Gfo/Idh/MocA family oxidoreductase [Spirochaetota bacterium]|nr:Gfo/Idh/MocA family oxidoreductase [Spirochaetota bacterium]